MSDNTTIKLTVDGKPLEAAPGTTLLAACLQNQIYVPNLCHLDNMDRPHASCRLCFVEVRGEDRPVSSCTVKVREGMVVTTDTPAVRRLQRSALRLLLSVHDADCAHCPANKQCPLQDMARFLGIGLKPKGLDHILKEPAFDDTHPFLRIHPNRCVLCGRCIHVCREANGRSHLTFARRGFDTVITAYGGPDSPPVPCESCRACIDICPVCAITPRTAEGLEDPS